MSKTESLADALPREQKRVRELQQRYREIGAPGQFAVSMMDAALTEAEQAAGSGDVVRMLKAYEGLKGFSE